MITNQTLQADKQGQAFRGRWIRRVLFAAHGRSISLYAFSFLLTLALPALAEQPPRSIAQAAGPTLRAAPAGWSVTLGAGVLTSPEYEGSRQYRVRAIPLIDVRYADWLSASVQQGVRLDLLAAFKVNAMGDARLRAGPLIRYRFGRDESDSSRLRGLGDLDGAVEVGGFAGVTIGSLGFDLVGIQAVNDGSHEGALVELSAQYRIRPAEGLSIAVGPSLAWASDRYMERTFGVSAAQSTRSGLRRYDAQSGIKDWGFRGQARYEFTEAINLTAIAGYTRLVGDAADAPIVADRGSANQFSAGLILGYRF